MSELFSGTRTVGYYGESQSFSIGTQTNNLSLGITLIQVPGTNTDGEADTTSPSNTSISINSNADNATSTSVTLAISATDNVGVTGYYASESSTTPEDTVLHGQVSPVRHPIPLMYLLRSVVTTMKSKRFISGSRTQQVISPPQQVTQSGLYIIIGNSSPDRLTAMAMAPSLMMNFLKIMT